MNNHSTEAAETDWRPLSTASPDDMEAAVLRTETIIRQSAYGTLNHDLRYIETKIDGPTQGLEIYVKEQGGRVQGYAPVVSHPSRLSYALGEFSLFSLPVQRKVIQTTPLTLPGETGDPEGRTTADPAAGDADLGEDFVVWMRRRLKRKEVVFLQETRENCPLYRAIKDPKSRLRQHYYVVQFGPLYQHRTIEFAGTYDDYLAGLSSKTRADLARTRRRFIARTNEKYETRCFTRPDEVDTFIADAARVSAKTYQFKLLGAGLRDQVALKAQFEKTAALGWFRSYVLYVDGEPAAFQVGQVYNGTFNALDIGYDPALAKMQIGIFLHTEIVSDLLSRPGAVTGWDFGNLDTLHKRRLSNRSERSGFFYLLPKGPRGALISISMNCMNAMSAALGRLLDRFHIRQKVKNLLRLMGAAR